MISNCMAARTLVWFSMAMAVTMTMSGQAPSSVKAGDAAPKLTYSTIVASAGDSAGPENFAGRTTVLLFPGPVVVNKQEVAQWNELVERFADNGVNFVWIAKEKEESLVPFLATHPVRGWMVLDPGEESYKAYGVEGGAGVLIDSRGIIAGFTSLNPKGEQIQAVLDGSAVAVDGEASEDQLDAFFEGKPYGWKRNLIACRHSSRRASPMLRLRMNLIFRRAGRKGRSAPRRRITGCGAASN
jgi:peroxiredoxin